MLDRPSLGQLLSAALERWNSDMATILARHSPLQLGAAADLLVHITPEGVPQSALPPLLGLSKQAVQQSLDQLEQKGLVRRDIVEQDRRARIVHLTDEGAHYLVVREEAARAAEKALRRSLGRDSMSRLRKGLRKVGGIDKAESSR
jgi:DNA-binding MarR family transcriptional regulator